MSKRIREVNQVSGLVQVTRPVYDAGGMERDRVSAGAGVVLDFDQAFDVNLGLPG